MVLTFENSGKVLVAGRTAPLALCNFSKNSPRFSDESEPPSGEPLEYIVANFPSKINLNQPFDPFESSKAAASDQM